MRRVPVYLLAVLNENKFGVLLVDALGKPWEFCLGAAFRPFRKRSKYQNWFSNASEWVSGRVLTPSKRLGTLGME